MIKIFLLIFIVLPITGYCSNEFDINPESTLWKEIYEPAYVKPTELPSNTALRKTLFNILRPQIESEAKVAVQFSGEIKAFKNWAFFIGRALNKQGAAVGFEPMDNSDIVALWLRTKSGWQLIDYSTGHSDAFYFVWAQMYGVPNELLGPK